MRKLVIGLVVLLVLLVGADFALRYIATRQISEAVATRLQLSQQPAVSISGFPFITQALNGEYDTISASLPPTTFGPVSNVSVNVDLLGVRIPLSDAVRGNVDALTAQSSQVRVTIPVSSVAAAVGLPTLQVTGAGDSLAVTTTVTVLNQQYPITAQLGATITDSVLHLSTGPISGLGISLPAEIVAAIPPLVALGIPLTGLPFVITSGAVSAVGSTLVLDATTSALNLAGP
jgi:hypothetical protein